MMTMNPWVVMGGGLVLSIGSMMGVMYTAPESPAHYGCWALFSAMQGITLSPLCLVNPAIIGRAALYTAGAVGGISYVGATAKSDQYLWLGKPFPFVELGTFFLLL
jgi:FtsH-binding integral membrane protein